MSPLLSELMLLEPSVVESELVESERVEFTNTPSLTNIGWVSPDFFTFSKASVRIKIPPWLSTDGLVTFDAIGGELRTAMNCRELASLGSKLV